MKAMFSVAVVLGACGGGDDGVTLDPPLVEVPGMIQRIAVNDASLFAHDATTNTLIEFAHDGTQVGTIEPTGEVLELAAAADTVAWVEVEGTGTVVKRRIGDAIESQRTFAARVIANDEGLFYSDIMLVASWGASGVPERIATPGTEPRLLDVDATFAYTIEGDTSVVQYERMDPDMTSEVLLEETSGATVKDGELAYRTAEGVRKKDLFMGFDRVVGAVPENYECELLIAGRAVMCGKFRANEGTLDELLRDPVTGYASVDSQVYWGRTEGAVTAIRVVDAEAVTAE